MESSDIRPSIAPAETINEACNNGSKIGTIKEDAINPLENPKNLARGDGMITSSQRPLTTSIRRTISHLLTLDDFGKSCFRGLGHMLFFVFLQIGSYILLLSAIPDKTNTAAEGVLISLAAKVSKLLTVGSYASIMHAIVSTTPRPFFQRFPPVKTWKYLILPTCLTIFCSMLVSFLFLFYNEYIGLAMTAMTLIRGGDGEVNFKLLVLAAYVNKPSPWIPFFSIFYYILIPSLMSLYRIQASLLPTQDETIVPFDRTFGGRAKPTGIDGRKVLGFHDALRSVTAADRQRIAILTAKTILISLGILAVGCLSVWATSWCVSGGLVHEDLIQAFLILIDPFLD